MADIIYDIEALERAKEAIEDLIDTLNECNTNLNKDMQELEKGWQTDAGTKFFEEHRDAWTEYVKKYVARIKGVQSMLEMAISYYQAMDDEVANLKV